MIFLKHFETARQTLYGIGKTYVQRNAKVSDLYSYINEKMRYPAGLPLKLYEVNTIYCALKNSILIHLIRKSNLA